MNLLEIRGLHQTLAYAYLMGSHPTIGPAARRGFAMVWRFFRDEMGLGADEARAFMAEGMLISTMIGLRLVDDYGSDPQITELFRSCFPTELPHVLDLVPRGVEPWSSSPLSGAGGTPARRAPQDPMRGRRASPRRRGELEALTGEPRAHHDAPHAVEHERLVGGRCVRAADRGGGGRIQAGNHSRTYAASVSASLSVRNGRASGSTSSPTQWKPTLTPSPGVGMP